MASSFAAPAYRAPFEDVLEHLPVSATKEYRKGQIVYGPHQPSPNIFLIAAGKVKLSQIAEGGREILLEIIRPDELFGESAFVNGHVRTEQATAFEDAQLMVWPISAVEGLVTKRPRLAVSLLQISAQRTVDFAHRIESFSIDKIERRLARSLIHFSERLGTPEGDGSVRMVPFTHELLSRYIGTSREIVTFYMNQFRKRGYLRYSRQEIVLHPDALAAWIARTASSAVECAPS
ncbi:MAG TPA: Crp/Fnr family transcriptional regulator [Bryobacteraceae bacterium]|nr:Crp/Fnr family transcriptional regulator [Bryobacteraceae bacterium]